MRKGKGIALLPIGVFLVLYLGLGILFEYVMEIPMGFYNVPIVVAFLAAILAVLRARQSMEMGDAFHAYIIDWRLPDMNGIEVTRQIRSLGDDTPIIILTAYDWSDIEVEARAAGVTAFCAKPMFMSDIRETLMAAIGQKQAGAEDNILPAAD